MMTIEEAQQIARDAAKAKPESYYQEPFEPHPWVVDAVLAGAERMRRRVLVEDGLAEPTDDEVLSFALGHCGMSPREIAEHLRIAVTRVHSVLLRDLAEVTRWQS